MEIRWLQAFVAVAEELHFGRAAARLQMAQSPLSQTVRKLEKDLGVPLFERNTRSVALTAGGHAFLPHAYHILESVETAQQATRASAGGVYGRIKIGFTGVLNHLSLPPLTRALRQRYPDIELDLVGRIMTREAVTQLESGALDLAFVGLPVQSAAVATRLIRRESFGAVLPSDHPLAGEPEIDLHDLADDGFITTPLSAGSALQESAMRACLDAGFRPRVVQEITDPYMILVLVSAGVGVALMTSSIATITPPGTVFVPLADASVYMHHGIGWSPRRVSPALEVALRVAEEILPTPD
ncbi:MULTISPECIES: LysR family transcriptional regulator [Rhodococcus]|uniref:LysR family transcriptional regulator n=1 Tax=Rhodococcus TaxID=1827 RepID=UPI00029A8631|nr:MULTISPECIES: LysR family transcriptional regulator [Rhodococcus]ATQ29885.1 LysR family transcriptional regulator [Rhodococcus ruber]AUM18906.1 LysR family transcriptional regulator [Rhodococcus ruber]MBD8053983.1 LysR family transcriptional regulator [Rhodococcus ruber]MBP2213908.1 DNA-binding transcriptional LysR family regulator [Rhodococcus ruber]MCF8785015.1 LysR family transcriptional regulator [Rhodococcus ruber]